MQQSVEVRSASTQFDSDMVVIVFGLPGSGKSYFAVRLAEKLGAEYINSDRLRKEMFEERTYSDKEKAAVYAGMKKKMHEVLHDSGKLVLDGTFFRKQTRDEFEQSIANRTVPFFIEMKATDKIARERLKRKRPFSEADYRVYQIIRSRWEPMEKPHLVLQSTNENIDDLLNKAMEYLQS